jgi:hypothetical protein
MKLSKKKLEKKREIARIKKKLFYENPVCFFSNCSFSSLSDCDAFHIIPIGRDSSYETNEMNIVLSERRWNSIYDQGTTEEIKEIPNINKLLDRMKEIDEGHYNRLIDRLYGC